MSKLAAPFFTLNAPRLFRQAEAGGMAGGAPRRARLRVLATTDVHVHLAAWDYCAGRATRGMGLERTASLIAAARAEVAASILVDNGDFLQGSPLGDRSASAAIRARGRIHPAIAAMNSLGYDAAALGNHEFDYGLDFLDAALADAAFPVLCANLVRQRGAGPQDDLPYRPPVALIDRQVFDESGTAHGVRIGLIGLAPPQTIDWAGDHLKGRLVARDMAEAARAWVPALRKAGAEVVIALAHTGIAAARDACSGEAVAMTIARLPGIDAIVAGHTHAVFPSAEFAGLPEMDADAGRLAGRPAVMPGFGGSHLGVIDLELEHRAGRWAVSGGRGSVRSVEALRAPPCPALRATIRAAHVDTIRHLRRRIGSTLLPLNSYFALVADSPALRLVCEAQATFVRRALAGTEHAALPVLSAAAPFKAGGRGGPGNYTDVSAGRLALRNVADLYAFPNALRAVRVTGTELVEWLERSAAIFRHIGRDRCDQPLIDPDFRSHNFDVIAGVTYAIDPTTRPRYDAEGRLLDPAAYRVQDLRHKGRRVLPQDEFIVATNSYRVAMRERDGTAQRLIPMPERTNREVLLHYIASHGTILAPERPGWRLTAPPGTSLTFETSPKARDHLASIEGLCLEHLGDAPGGFARFRLRA